MEGLVLANNKKSKKDFEYHDNRQLQPKIMANKDTTELVYSYAGRINSEQQTICIIALSYKPYLPENDFDLLVINEL